MKVIKSLRAPVLVTLVLLLICGLIYPVVMTGLSQALFPSQANGSIIYVDGQAVGAKNVGQDFTDPRFMRCRPSAYQYNTYTEDEEAISSTTTAASTPAWPPAPTTTARPTPLWRSACRATSTNSWRSIPT